MAERFLTISEIADGLNVTRASVYNFIKSSDFPKGFKFGRVRRWKESEVEAWINSRGLERKESI